MNILKKLDSHIHRNLIRYEGVIYLFMALVIVCVVCSLKNISLGTHDDINMFVDIQSHSLKEYSSLTISNSLARGRISPVQIIANMILYGVMLTKSQLLYTMLMYIPIIVNVLFFAYIIGKRFGKYFGLFIPVFFFALIQVDAYHNLMISYPLCMQVGLFMFLLGIDLFLRYSDNQKKILLFLSALCMFDSFSAYESFVCFYAVFFIIALFKNIESVDNKNSFKWVNFVKHISVHTVTVLLYIIIYFICRHFSSLSYDGATIDTASFSFSLAVKTLLTFAFSLFPLREFAANFSFIPFPVSAITFRMIVKAACVGIASWMILYKSKKIQIKHMICLAITGFIACVVFCIPHSLTPQYQYWVSIGVQGFVPSFISYFGVVLILCTIAIYLSNFKSKWKKAIIILISISMCFGSLCTDISNQTTIKSKTNTTISYKLFDRMVQTEYYADLENDAVIFTTDYSGIHNVISTLGAYGALYSGKDYYYTNDINDVMQFKHKYYLSYDADNQCISLSHMSGKGLVDSVYIMSYSASETINTFCAYKTSSMAPTYLNNSYYADFGSIIKFPITDSDNGVLIQSQNIVMDSYKLTNENSIAMSELTDFSFGETYEINQSILFIDFVNGWGIQENWGRWSEGYESQMMLLLSDTKNNDVQVVMNVRSLKQEDGLNVEICSDDQVLYNEPITEAGTIVFTVPDTLINDSGIVYLDIYCNNAVSPKELGLSIDDRVLGIGIEDVTINLR